MPRGALVVIGGPKTNRWVGPMGDLVKAVLVGAFTRGQRLTGMLARTSRTDLELLARLMEAGEVRPMIERTYPLSELPAALRHVGGGHSRGKVVVVPGA